MVAAATTLRDTIESGWALTGELNKVAEGAGPTLMDEVVQFWDRKQVEGNEVPKGVIVEKINSEGNEIIVKRPNFNEVSDIYDITVAYRVVDVQENNFSSSLDLIESMASEVVRILTTVYNPSATLGIYFRTASSWTNEDVYAGNQPELRRKLRFQLTTILSDNDEAYTGFSGVLIFDTSASAGDNKPAADYTYVGVEGVKIREGYTQIPLLTKDITNGIGVPFQTRGLFSGTFTAIMVASKSNIIGSNLDKIQSIYRVQNNPNLKRQNATVVLLHTVSNSLPGNTVLAATVTNPGTGYTTSPTVAITGGGGTGATAVAVINGTGNVIDLVITNAGTGYTSVPTIGFTGGGGSNAAATAVLSNANFTTQSFMKIDNIFKDSMDEDLVKYVVTGTLTKPSVFSEAT